MAEDAIELGLEGASFMTDKFHDRLYDKLPARDSKSRRSSSVHFAEDSDGGCSDGGRGSARRTRGRTSNEFEDRRNQRWPSTGDGESHQRSRYEQDNRPQTGYSVDPELSYNQSANHAPYAPPSSTTSYPPRPRTDSRPHTPTSRQRRYYSQSPSPPPSRQRERKSSGSDLDVTSGVLGALAGGIVGSRVGKGSTLTTVVAAAIGAVGAHQAEKKYGKHRQKVRRERREDRD
ncbi:MAG: hypothetical protein LQ347_002926 [Umbilicaria vellea]|nr:MAG: hypothetical protein LQ347_002926 [Umbilicaria vellea]